MSNYYCLLPATRHLLRRNVVHGRRLLPRLPPQMVPGAAALSSAMGDKCCRYYPQQQQQQRTMVMVTKTSPSDLPPSSSQKPLDGSSSPPEQTAANAATSSNELLTITPSCINQIHALLKRKQKSPDEMFLRVFVDAGGCSGFTYQFDLDDEMIEGEDVVFQPPGSDGVRVVVDEASLNLIRGSRIDYVREMIKSAFVVADNPQSESACGCGSSFAVKNFAAAPALD